MFRIYGGVARVIFSNGQNSISGELLMKKVLQDVDAVKGVKSIGNPTQIFQTTHTLLHIIVTQDGTYQFSHVDIASDYVGEQLLIRHCAQMISNLQEMLGSPVEISRHLFEIYGHIVFSIGKITLKCRCLEDGSMSDMTLDDLNGQRVTFGKDSIPAEIQNSYYEPAEDDNFPAIDSLSPQGMFQFTVASTHPIRGVSILRKICKLYRNSPKLFFVVPTVRFHNFKKQIFRAMKGTKEVNPIADLKQYVLELPITQTFFKDIIVSYEDRT